MNTSNEPMDEFQDVHGLSALYNFVYCSRAAAGVDQTEVEKILAASRRNNPSQGITGLLVFGGGVFFQWLEGPRESVIGLIERLNSDPRHNTIISLDESEEVRDRMFPDWDMELVTPSDIRDVLADALANAEDTSNAQGLRRLLHLLDSGQLKV